MSRTPLFDWHVANHGRIVDFAGWDMPVQYSTIVEEHQAVRQQAGLFDISHMGRLFFDGPQACELLDHLLTNDVTKLQVGQIRYSLVTNSAGGILDDVLVYRFDDFYMLVVNASNREKIVAWIDENRDGFEANYRDETLDRAMIAIQGPLAVQLLTPHVAANISDMKYYTGISTTVDGVEAIVSRTGYTGEDGFEVIVPNNATERLWTALLKSGAKDGVRPAGLGARDTLRLEAAMPLYGHEMTETTDPFAVGLGFAVKLEAGDFIGKSALVKAKAAGPSQTRIGLKLEGRRPAREGCQVFTAEDSAIGEVTSGTFSPTLQTPVAMASVTKGACEIGQQLSVDIRGKRAIATVVKLPFYRR